MDAEHDVFAIPPGETRTTYIATFDRRDWVWAEKLAGLLEDKGYTNVEVITRYPNDELSS